MSRANHRPLSRRWRKGFALLVSLAATCPPRVGFTDPGMMGSLGVGSMDDQFRTGAGANHGTSTGSDELPRGASGNSPAATGERLYGGPVTVTHTAAADGRVTLGSSFRNAEKLTPAGRRELAEKAESNLRTNPNDSNSVHALANIVAVQLDKGEGVKTEHVDILAAAGAADDQKTTAPASRRALFPAWPQ